MKNPSKKKVQEIRDLIIRLRKIKKEEERQLSNWEIDDHYERNLKKFDTE